MVFERGVNAEALYNTTCKLPLAIMNPSTQFGVLVVGY